jgi:hypothetical protein
MGIRSEVMIRRRWCIGVIALVIAAATMCGMLGCGREEPASRYEPLFPDPDSVRGIGIRSAISEYRDSTLFDFLNGGAELYFDYDILAVASAEYGIGRDPSLELSIYDMGSTDNAFGIYSNLRYAGADFVNIGAEGMKTVGSVDFWKGRYYCRLVAFETDSVTQAGMTALAKATAANIAGGGGLPGIVDLLPVLTRVSGSEKYFRGPLSLNNIRYVASENLLMLSTETEGAIAEYLADGATMTGFIIAYQDPRAAGAAHDSYTGFLSRRGRPGSYNGATAFVLDDGSHIMIARHDAYLVGVWDGPDAETGYAFVGGALAALERAQE